MPNHKSETWPVPWNLLQPLCNWITRYPLLLVVPALLLLISADVILTDFDAAHLLWHEQWWQGMLAGLAVGLLLSEVCFVGYLVDLRRATESKHVISWRPYLVWATVLAVAVVVPAFWVEVDMHWWKRLWFPAGVGLVVLANWIAGLLQWRRATPIFTTEIARGILIVLLVVFLIMFALHEFIPDFFFRPITPAVSVCLALGFVVAIICLVLSRLSHTAWLYPILLAALLVPFLTAGGVEQRYHVPGLEDYDRGVKAKPQLSKYEADHRYVPTDQLGDQNVLEAWLKLRQAEEASGASPSSPYKPPLYVVCTSGGASASALFTARILCELTLQGPQFPGRVRIITGASGGMLGAAYFVARLQDGFFDQVRQLHRDFRINKTLSVEEFEQRKHAIRKDFMKPLRQDFLSPLMQKWVFKDGPIYFVPSSTTNDRGRALENAWSSYMNACLERPFVDLRPDEALGKIPSLIFSPMIIEDGRQCLISNLDLSDLVLKQDDVSRSGIEFFKLFPDADQFRLSTAVRMNASFPFFSPETELPTNPVRRLVDAGYYDNYGTCTAAAWLRQNREWLQTNTQKVVLLQLRAYGNENQSRDYVTRKEKKRLERGDPNVRTSIGFHSLTAPIVAAFAARRSTMVYRGDERIQHLTDLFNARNRDFFEGHTYECATTQADWQPSLNWYLTDADIRKIDALVDEYIVTPGRISEYLELVRQNRAPAAAPAEITNAAGKIQDTLRLKKTVEAEDWTKAIEQRPPSETTGGKPGADPSSLKLAIQAKIALEKAPAPMPVPPPPKK